MWWAKAEKLEEMFIYLHNVNHITQVWKKYSHIYVKASSYPQKIPSGKDGNEEIFRCSFWYKKETAGVRQTDREEIYAERTTEMCCNVESWTLLRSSHHVTDGRLQCCCLQLHTQTHTRTRTHTHTHIWNASKYFVIGLNKQYFVTFIRHVYNKSK